MNALFAIASGLVFGIGLILSGMTDPSKVQGFLDLAGHWDPSLAFVMMGAIGVGFFAFSYARRLGLAWTGAPIDLPVNRQIDRRLVIGGALFGVGWGVAGFCPGPALVSLGAGDASALVFVIAMLAGMQLHDRVLAAAPASPLPAATR